MAGPMPPQEAPAEAAPAEGGQDQFAELVSNLSDGLSMLSQLASQVDSESAQAFDQINQQFQGAVEGMAQKMGGGQQPAPQGQGMASPEQGASGAKPAGPAY